MTPPIWLLLFFCSISITGTPAEIVFSVKPEDGVGVLNRSLMLHCAAHDTSHQTELLVKWEKQNGELATGVQQLANGSLYFPLLNEEELGGYVCGARKGSKQIRSVVTVSKAYLENVFFNPQSQNVAEGQSVFFQCVSGDSSPTAHISWLKNRRVFTRGIQLQGQYGGGSQRKTSGTLHLTNLTKEDQGQYACVTYNSLLNISKESSTASLIIGLRISLEIMQGPENLTVAVETSAVLQCVVQGFPTPKVQWFKDGQTVANISRWNLHDDGQLLVFKKVLLEDEGFYYCEAENNKQRLRSQPGYLLPAVMDWTFVLQPVNQTVRKGDPVTLNCRPPHSRPPAQITWFRNHHLLQFRSHISTQSTGDLLFLSVQETDRGVYHCQAFNSFLQRTITSKKIFLEVLAPPSVTIWPLAVISAVGAEVVIQCQVSGHPVPSIDWLKHGQSVRTGGKISKGVRNSTLYISSVRIYDEGLYTCTASNTVGQDEKTTRLRITVKPVIVLFVGSMNVSKGATINLPCQAVGIPPLKYTWRRSVLQTPLSPSSRIRIDDNETLQISNVHQSDSGEYYCTAENIMGQDRRKTIITVFSADPDVDLLSSIPQIKTDEPTNPTNQTDFSFYKDINKKNSSTLQVSVPSLSAPFTSSSYHDKYKDLVITPAPQSLNPNAKTPEARTQKRHVTERNPFINYSDQQKFQTSDRNPFSQNPLQSLSDQQTNSKQVKLSSNSELHKPSQTSGFTLNSLNGVTSTTSLEVHQYRSQLTERFTVTKASQTNNTELIEMLDKNTSKAPMRTTANNAREKTKSWLPVLEKHDIPIVVGVGVSLAFIFITMSFYSLFQKNNPTARTTGRAALRGIGGPCRPGEHPTIERTYDNKAFEDDNMVAVIEQSPTISEMRAYPPASSPSTLRLEPSCHGQNSSQATQAEFQPSQDMPVIVETHLKPSEDEQLETPFEEGKTTPSLLSDVQLQCMEDWRSQDSGQCQRGAPSPPLSNSLGTQEEGLHSSLTLQTLDSSSTPVNHSISLSHANCPLMLSHCVTLGLTSVSVDVHFYPSDPAHYRHQTNSRHEHDESVLSSHHGKP